MLFYSAGMGRFILVLVLLIAVTNAFLLNNIDTVYLFVSPSGLDSNTGRDVGHPFKTIHKGVSHIRDKDLQGKNIIIELMAGYYDLHSTLRITHTDSRRVTIRAYQDQQVHVTGGKRIESQYFHPVTDQNAIKRLPIIARHKVYQVVLRDAGITNLGVMSNYGSYIHRKAPLEIFENGKPLTLARYPNKDYLNIVSVQPNSSTSFTYASDRPRQWHGENDIWTHGFWYWSWADRAIKVQHIDPQHRTITLAKPTVFGLRKGHYSTSNPTSIGFRDQGGYFKFVNVLSELDEPGEYFVDRDNGILYIWPSSSQGYKSGDIIYASIVNDCIQVSAHSGNIVLEGFVLEACRRYGVRSDNTQNISVSRMQIKNTGSYGIYFTRGSNIKVIQCDIRQTDGGVLISGGHRTTLIPSGNEVSDNVITHFGRVGLVGSDGITSGGVGNHIHHNVLWRGSYIGIRWTGNDHLFEYNHISEMCLNASDCGGMQTGRDWTYRGNVIRYNHIHDTKRLVPGADVRGIMLDDQYSSALIEKNVFHDNDVHVNIGGGRDNIIRQNIFYNTLQYSMQVDSRGLNRADYKDDIMKKLDSMPYTGTLWTQKYPKLATIKSTHPYLPVGNLITKNIFYAVQKENVHGNPHRSDWFNITDNAYENNEQSFYAPSYGNFKPLCLLQDFATRTQFPDPVLPANVGQRYPVGPKHIFTEQPKLGYIRGHTPSPKPCTTHAPSVAPTKPYLPDGSSPNILYNVSRVGCWFAFDKCPNHPELQKDHRLASTPYYRDISGEKQDQSGTSETACLGKVAAMVSKCGGQSSFAVIYGPTGAMTLGGEGCYFAQYGCPKHGSHHVGFIRDVWAEKTQNAANDENACLSRALPQWRYCGSSSTSPIVSIYRPTGHIRVAGYGCWIKPEKCVKDNTLNAMFYDGWGAANAGTDKSEGSCFQRAEYFWRYCGNHAQYKVTAYFRPSAKSFTYP